MEQPSIFITLTIFLCMCLSWVHARTQHHHHHHNHHQYHHHNHHHHYHHQHKSRRRHNNNSSSNNGTHLNASPPPGDLPLVGNSTFFNVKALGAVGDGVSDDTRAFQMAWDYACQVDHATIFVPMGSTFMIRSLIFAGPCRKALHFQIEGVVVPPDGPDSWPSNNSKRQWLVFYRANGLTLHGKGRIDGKGEKWWELPCKPHRGINGTTLPGPCDSPVALRFFMCRDVTVHGLRVENSPQFHFRFDGCRNVVVDGITINAPSHSPNTDGIHVENTVSVGIFNSVISNGDDCVSIGSGSMDVSVSNVTCGHGHGISIGSLGKRKSRACVRRVRVANTTIKHSANGVRIKTWQGGEGSVSTVAFENMYMDDVRNPIIIDQYYCLSKPCANETGAVLVSDVSYANIRGTYDVRSPAMHFSCSDTVPCTNITLSDIDLLPAVGVLVLDPYCWNVYGDAVTLTIPPVTCMREGLPRMEVENKVAMC